MRGWTQARLLWAGQGGLAQFAPLFLLTLFAGTLADRVSRLTIVFWSLLAEFVGVLAHTMTA